MDLDLSFYLRPTVLDTPFEDDHLLRPMVESTEKEYDYRKVYPKRYPATYSAFLHSDLRRLVPDSDELKTALYASHDLGLSCSDARRISIIEAAIKDYALPILEEPSTLLDLRRMCGEGRLNRIQTDPNGWVMYRDHETAAWFHRPNTGMKSPGSDLGGNDDR